MSTRPDVIVSQHEAGQGTLRSYTMGFAASIYLTFTAYILVTHHLVHERWDAVAAVLGLAFLQFVIQLLFFLHLGRETRPRWKLMVFCFMIMVMLVIVLGSLWIMTNLNTRMTPTQMTEYMQNQTGL
jgi:cytochrome o ubiquinol oxidase operon protein cyoD